jgi:pentose-5-phosphate-3-epimerase
VKISASLYSSTNTDLPSLVHELEELNLDYFHIDCFDGQEEKVRKDVEAIQEISKTPIDLHVISSRSAYFFNFAEELKVKQLTLQFENVEDKLAIPVKHSYKFGLAVCNDTKLELLRVYEQELDYILLMTTTPGKSGGTFQKASFDRIRQCRQLYPTLPIYVDGGINAEVSFILRLLGVSMAVSGSFLVNNNNSAVALADLRFHQKGSHFLLEDFMQTGQHLPILNEQNASFQEIVRVMESRKMGFVLFENKGKLSGISSNADLRRGILNHLDDLNQIQAQDVINKSPVTIQASSSTYEMISLIKQYNFPILFLPVINEVNDLLGVITFNELIKGEG